VKVQIEMYIDEEDESIVMQKLSLLTKQAKEQGFNIGEIELKRSRHKDDNEHKHYKYQHDGPHI
jgi:hypothetical protein